MTDKNMEEFTNAVHKGNIEKVKEFVKNGIDVNSKNPRQLVLLQYMLPVLDIQSLQNLRNI